VIGHVLRELLVGFNVVVLIYFAALNTTYLLMSLIAFRGIRRYARRLRSLDLTDLLSAEGVPPVTIIAPAYNEGATCVESVRSLLTLNYDQYEILFVNDGSRDHTLERMREAFELVPAARLPSADIPTAPVRKVFQSRRHPNLWVVDKENGGKADALNAGLNLCLTPLYCAVDSDSLLERDALGRIVRPFLEEAHTVAVGGVIRIVNGCTVKDGVVERVRMPRGLLARFQVLDYLRSFLAGRMGWHALDATLIISGAFGVFRRSTVVAAGGYATDRTGGATVGEDMELVVRLHRHCRERGVPYRITFVPDPVAWTECPETLRTLARQRDRWQRGMVETLIRHRVMFLRPRYGRIGMVAFPYFVLLETAGLAIEITGYVAFLITIALGLGSKLYMLGFFTAAFAFGMVLSIAAVALEELGFRRYPERVDLLRLFGLAALENFGYRQLISLFRARGLVSALRGVSAWGEHERRGFEKPAAAAPVARPRRASLPAAPAPARPAVDLAELKQAVGGGDDAIVATIVGVFLEDGPRRLADLEHAITGGDAAAVRSAAHAWRSSAATIRARGLARLLGEMEAAAERGDVAAARALMPAVRAEREAVERELRRDDGQ
jgi:cellulose synthase/poly-beta-1,6-N-acetylglucosamine synthase-like glycosyltransferase/HPt (histidine-containing phosphotransfer) domain-containing protein